MLHHFLYFTWAILSYLYPCAYLYNVLIETITVCGGGLAIFQGALSKGSCDYHTSTNKTHELKGASFSLSVEVRLEKGALAVSDD